MSQAINALMITAPDAYTLEEQYSVYIESLIGYLRNDPSTRVEYLAAETTHLYRFDMTTFLLTNGVPLEDHRLVLRMNGLHSVHQIDSKLRQLMIPDQSVLARLKSIYRAANQSM